jgi:hypothetical protein
MMLPDHLEECLDEEAAERRLLVKPSVEHGFVGPAVVAVVIGGTASHARRQDEFRQRFDMTKRQDHTICAGLPSEEA